MKARIVQELRVFLETSGISAKKLSQVSGVSEPTISRLKNGGKKDICSRFADALRDAMKRLQSPRARRRKPPEAGDNGGRR